MPRPFNFDFSHSGRLAAIVLAILITVTAFHHAVAQATTSYKLSPDDLLDFRVIQEPDMDAVIRISGDGQAIFPMIGAVKIGGLSTAQATDLVAARLRDGYLGNPQVSITVRTYAMKLFTILGQVQKPGAYNMQGLDEISLLEAIGMAGGYTPIADQGSVTVKRFVEGHEKIMKFNAKRMAQGKDHAIFMIRAQDTISVGEALF
jgi:polysaccharide export outer membrane protein